MCGCRTAVTPEEAFKAGWIVGLQKASVICYVRAHEWAAALEKPDKLLLNDDIRLEYEARKDEAFACRAAIEKASGAELLAMSAPPAHARLVGRLRAEVWHMPGGWRELRSLLTEAANALSPDSAKLVGRAHEGDESVASPHPKEPPDAP